MQINKNILPASAGVIAAIGAGTAARISAPSTNAAKAPAAETRTVEGHDHRLALDPTQVELSLIKDKKSGKIAVRAENGAQEFVNEGMDKGKVFTVTQKPQKPRQVVFPAGVKGEDGGTGIQGQSTGPGIGPARQFADTAGFTANELGTGSLLSTGPLDLKASPFPGAESTEQGTDTGAGLPAVSSTSTGEAITGDSPVPSGNPPLPHSPSNVPGSGNMGESSGAAGNGTPPPPVPQS
jgi:hypothetical protein